MITLLSVIGAVAGSFISSSLILGKEHKKRMKEGCWQTSIGNPNRVQSSISFDHLMDISSKPNKK